MISQLTNTAITNNPCEEDSMIIAPTPIAALDQNSVNQSQQQQTQSSEISRKATVTVQVSSQARELAGTKNNDETPPQQKTEAQVIKQNNEAFEANKQQAISPSSKQPESNKIDVVV